MQRCLASKETGTGDHICDPSNGDLSIRPTMTQKNAWYHPFVQVNLPEREGGPAAG
jgi:hypothetical protein